MRDRKKISVGLLRARDTLLTSSRHFKMNDEEKLEMTYRRLNNFRLGNASLLKLSMTQAVQNICSYDEGDLEKLVKSTKELEMIALIKLPKRPVTPLLENMFEAFMKLKSTPRQMHSDDDFEKRLKVLKYLLRLPLNVNDIEIGDGLMSFSPDSSKASNCIKVAKMFLESSFTENICASIYPSLSYEKENLPLESSALEAMHIHLPGPPDLHTLFPSARFLKIEWFDPAE
ncbi:Hypothetical predicted protein [Cloeon dipterum]|uniref:Uncharacterized protein n=1 Tax=Cloeon dipterum TaxID=197152 RepID=A0A8S1CYY6_9INSE|nr:Hypothetical predicted protein [Cloeon dipterum]